MSIQSDTPIEQIVFDGIINAIDSVKYTDKEGDTKYLRRMAKFLRGLAEDIDPLLNPDPRANIHNV